MTVEEKKNKITPIYVRSKDGHSWEPALQLLTDNGKAKITRPIFNSEQVRRNSVKLRLGYGCDCSPSL